MALSDVTVEVNLVTSTGTEPVWFPLFVANAGGASAPGQPIKQVKTVGYTECTTLQQLIDLLALYADGESRTEHQAKQGTVKGTLLYQAIAQMYRQNGHPNRFAVIVAETDAELRKEIEAAAHKSWRQIVPTDGVQDSKSLYGLAAYIEHLEQRKMLFFNLSSISNATYEDDSGSTYALTDFSRTVCVYSGLLGVAAVVGATAGKSPGSINYRNVILNNTEAYAVTEEELAELHRQGFMVPVERAGNVVTSTGLSASQERYIDTIDIEDYVVQQLVYVTQKTLNENDIVPYNNDGIAVLESAATSVMLDCCTKGMIARSDTNTYAYEVNYPAMSYVTEADIANRTYQLGTVAFTAQGAIDKVDITVEMTL